MFITEVIVKCSVIVDYIITRGVSHFFVPAIYIHETGEY